MKTQQLKTKVLSDLRKLIREKFIQETGQNPFAEILYENNQLPTQTESSTLNKKQ